MQLTAIKDSRGKGKGKAQPNKPNDNDDFVPVGEGGKAKYTFSGMTQALAPTTRIDTVVEHKDDGDNDSDASSELRLSYVDDIPLKQRFPTLKPPAAKTPIADPSKRETTSSAYKPLTITLPATGHKPSRSVTDILRELKSPAPAVAESTASKTDIPLDQDAKAPTSIRFDGGSVAYSSSALASEAAAFAAAIADSNLPSQPSPSVAPASTAPPLSAKPLARATSPHPPPAPHD